MDYGRITGMLDRTFAWSLARTFSREEAEELTQEILFQAIKSIGELRDDSKFEPWFWRLAEITLKVFKRGRAKNRSTMSFYEVTYLAFEDEYNFEADEEYQNLRRSIAQLSAVYRDIIVMHYYDGLSCRDISQKLGLPEGTVTYRLSLARNKLKERCDQMNETALKPVKLMINIIGSGNYNGEDRPFPSQYINDALSQNILWYSYREPKTVEELSSITGVPAYFIEERIDNLVRREAVIQPTRKTVQTSFLIFDKETAEYVFNNSGDFVSAVSEDFYRLSVELTEKMLSSGLKAANRTRGEIQCLLSVRLLEEFAADYSPVPYRQLERRYDGGRWDYLGFTEDGMARGKLFISIEKSMNGFEAGKLAHYSHHFEPFAYRRMMYCNEIDVCDAVLRGQELTDKQKEIAAELIANGYLSRDESGRILCTIPVFTRELDELFTAEAKSIFADFLPFYAEEAGKYLDGFLKLFPKHIRDKAKWFSAYIFVSLFKEIAKDWHEKGRINIPRGAVCDVLVMM